jgi:hypothetical protein
MILKQFDTAIDLNYKNLVVSGCSFTHNNSDSIPCSWPVYLRDLGGFDNVANLGLPGAGNNHIANSTHWHLENNQYDNKDTLVIVMWSGNDRDDSIVSIDSLNNYPMRFYYNKHTVTGISGGSAADSSGNISKDYFKLLQANKTHETRAVENYLLVSGLHHYLTAKQFKFVFLNYVDHSVPHRTQDFDITPHLPKELQQRYKSMFADIDNIYHWCLLQDLLSKEDDFHPSPDGHLNWTRDVLLPYLTDYL